MIESAIPFDDIYIFSIAAFGMVLTPGPNMIYIISRSLVQGRAAGFFSVVGIFFGFFFHILIVSLGLTALLLKIPYSLTVLKWMGIVYFLYLAYQSIHPNRSNIFEVKETMHRDPIPKLFLFGFLNNLLNPTVPLFYISIFPQFIKESNGSVLWQSLELGLIHASMFFVFNTIIVLAASTLALSIKNNPSWIKIQKWVMACVLLWIAFKMI